MDDISVQRSANNGVVVTGSLSSFSDGFQFMLSPMTSACSCDGSLASFRTLVIDLHVGDAPVNQLGTSLVEATAYFGAPLLL